MTACGGFERRLEGLAAAAAEDRRDGILELTEFLLASDPSGAGADSRRAIPLLEGLAQGDPDPSVRAVALGSLGRLPGAGTEAFLAALQDAHWLVRLEGLKGLRWHPDERAEPQIVRLLARSTEENLFVRLAAIDLAVSYRSQRALPALLEVARDRAETAGLPLRAFAALRSISGQGLPDDPDAWQGWLDGRGAIEAAPEEKEAGVE